MKRFQTESNQKHKLMEMREKIWFSIVKMSKITIILIRNAENLSLSSVWQFRIQFNACNKKNLLKQ